MTPKRNHIEERGQAGDYSDLVLPLDRMILENLTPEGTTMSGLYPIGSSVISVVKAINANHKGALISSQVSSRIRIMNQLGLVVKVKSLGQGHGGKAAWQRSVKADELLKQWSEGSNA